MLRDLVIVVLCILIGIGIGYYGEGIVRQYAPVTLTSTIVLTSNVNETVSVSDSVIFSVTLDTIVPQELSAFESQLKEFALKNKPVNLLIKVEGYWSVVDTKYTSFINFRGETSFVFTFNSTGTFEFKAEFEGDNVLLPCESEIVSVIVS